VSRWALWIVLAWTNRVGSYGDPAEYNDPMRPLMQPWIPQAPYIGESNDRPHHDARGSAEKK